MLKVLICGDVKGRLDLLHARVAKLNASAHGPFDLLFAVGQFPAPPSDSANAAHIEPYTGPSPALTFPIPLYYFGHPVEGLHEGSNLHHLGSAGVKQVRGLKVVFVDRGADVDDIIERASGARVHLLLTWQWPSEEKDSSDGKMEHEPMVSRVLTSLSCRYGCCETSIPDRAEVSLQWRQGLVLRKSALQGEAGKC